MAKTENDNLAEYLNSLEVNSGLHLVRTLKSSPAETTELVADEEGHLYVRKIIARESGLGGVYGQLKAVQDTGQVTPHLPRIWIFVKTESDVIVVMEYLPGENLWERLDREGCGMESARRYFPELCRAVEELHEGFDPPVIHRDLKPTNVIINAAGALKLVDFGISREYREHAATDTQFLGTREYAPPEQFGFRQTDERSDVYSLGMILYHILTGQTPSAALHDGGFADPDIPEALRAVLMQATEFDPERRFGSAAALRTAFEHALSGEMPEWTGDAGIVTAADSAAVAAMRGHSRFVAVLRDILAIAIVAFAVYALIVTWEDPGSEFDFAYRLGSILSGFVLFLPLLPIAYWVSSKRLLKSRFAFFAHLTRKQEFLYGLLFAVVMFAIAFIGAMMFTPLQG